MQEKKLNFNGIPDKFKWLLGMTLNNGIEINNIQGKETTSF
jgi:hypothetical protein